MRHAGPAFFNSLYILSTNYLLLLTCCHQCLTQEGQTPLHISCANDNKEVVALLLERGSKMDATDDVSVPMLMGPAVSLTATRPTSFCSPPLCLTLQHRLATLRCIRPLTLAAWKWCLCCWHKAPTRRPRTL